MPRPRKLTVCVLSFATPSPNTFYTANVDGVNDTTKHWPVRSALKLDLDKIKFGFQASPLPVYADHQFIKPEDVHGMLKGALVEVHFEFCHFCIKKKNKDSFNALVQQVIILQPGKGAACERLQTMQHT
jgi:hypothetical protein